MLPADLTTEIRQRLKTSTGHLNAIIRMLESPDCEPEKLIHQLNAVRSALEKSQGLLFDEVFRKALAEKIVKAKAACPGNCGYEHRIEELKSSFPNLRQEDLPRHLKEIQAVANFLQTDA